MNSRDTRRIVSLLPGATEWVCELGLADSLVGVSHECDYPQHVQTLPSVTRSRIDSCGTSQQIDAAVREHSETRKPLYDLDVELMASLEPDLILTQSLCNVCAVSERDVVSSISRMSRQSEVLDLKAQTFDQVMSDAEAISIAGGQLNQSVDSMNSLRHRIESVRGRVQCSGSPSPTVTMLEWVDPLFCAGHWTPQLIDWAGGVDPIGRQGTASRQIACQELFDADPDILLVACCGLDARRTQSELSRIDRRRGWSQMRCVKDQQVHVFDGSAYFNRPGPRLVDALESVAQLVVLWQQQHGLDH